ncbi:ninjurin-A isoform X2 [Drosophila albomicans]|uniref:Ninjurin-A isoform X1 n=1 Tax=Drosophila albomicans TaxID=7291 RepID=A0A6P8WDM9_DROAB|nr:ninjurin-A isoform X1 [Drosophila albomicans]XP_051861759.1 ninjurin-A isoform X2 [Drosophila albomicans]
MTDLKHITLQMDKLDADKSLAKSQGIHNEAIDDIDGRGLRVPRAVPETDDDENDDRPYTNGINVGVDDGLLADDEERGGSRGGSSVPVPGGGAKSPVPNGGRRPSLPYPGYSGNGFVNIDGVDTPVPDLNAYQHKKTLAQGMMDLALLSANANQLRYVLETNSQHPYFYPSLLFISVSIIFQIAVGVGLIWNGRYNIKKEEDICRANRINNYTVIGIFIVTVVNVLISAFGVAERAPVVPVPTTN